MLFHELTEEGRIDEIEMVGNFLDAFVRMYQFVFDELYGMFIDDGKRPFPTDILNHGRKVLR